jgi:hypothetical protein
LHRRNLFISEAADWRRHQLANLLSIVPLQHFSIQFDLCDAGSATVQLTLHNRLNQLEKFGHSILTNFRDPSNIAAGSTAAGSGYVVA